MEIAVISCRLAAFPLTIRPPQLSSSSDSKHKCSSFISARKTLNGLKASMKVESLFGNPSKGGSGLLERPNFEHFHPESEPKAEEGGDRGWLKDKRVFRSGDSYKVLLIDDERHTEKLVGKVLPNAVPTVTPDGARDLFHKSRENGAAVVIVTVKEHAEFYAEMMTCGGLRSAFEPDSNTVKMGTSLVVLELQKLSVWP